MTLLRVEPAAAKGAAFLRSSQLADGGFESQSSASVQPFAPKTTYLTTFTPALILCALRGTGNDDALAVKEKLAAWLVEQRSPAWSFNYWAAAAPERSRLRYPDDLDDTFVALIALRGHDPNLVDEACLGSVVKLLMAAEEQVGGPYRTWLATEDTGEAWHDVDLAVNSNIACFLGMVAGPLPNLTKLMETAISSGNLASPYYPSAYPLAYYISRAYNGPLSEELANLLLQKQRGGWWGNPLDTALSVSALSNLGLAAACERAVTRLLDSQLADGSWPAAAFCLDPTIQKKKHYSGSAALTTAFVVESLARYSEAQRPAKTAVKKPGDKNEDLLKNMARTARLEADALPVPLRQSALSLLEKMEEDDAGGEIRLLPYFFNQSLARPLTGTALLEHLGLATLYGWIAYSVYDDFLDNEGDPCDLSAANSAQRHSLKHFREALPKNTDFQDFVAKTFDKIDGANSWELANCHVPVTKTAITLAELPKYPNSLGLSDRSAGHALGPLGVLAAAGINPTDPRAVQLNLAICQYLAARQLNDDLHDWEADLKAGIITYVVADALRGLSIGPGKYALARLLPKAQKQVWYKTVLDICEAIGEHTSQARQAAKASGLLKNVNVIDTLADKIDASVAKTLAEQSKAIKFLAAYRKN